MRNATMIAGAAAVLSWAACGTAGCGWNRAPAPAEPSLRAVVSYSLGSPVDPPPAAGAPAGDPLVLTVRGYAADPASLPRGEPLAARGRLIIDSVSEPVATAPPAAESVRLVTDAASLPAPVAAGKGAVAVAETRALVPPGCTARIEFVPTASRGAAAPTLRLAVVSPSAAGANRPRLLVTAAPPADAAPEADDHSAVPRDRTVVLDWPLDGPSGEFALVFPPGAGRGVRRATVFRVGVAPARDDPEALQASARVVAGLVRAAGTPAVTRGQVLASALTAASGTPAMRRALAAVSAEVQADLAMEAALLLTDKELAAVAPQAAQALAAAPGDTASAQLGWLCDRAVLAALAKLSAGSEATAGVRAALSARFGEAGRDPGAVAEMASAAPSRADFEARVRAENVILLDDAAPASRVRAFDWASRQDPAGALKGYDPFGPAPGRRKAIDEYLQSLTPATQPTSKPSGGPHE